MKNLNNRGFFLVETLIVTSIVAVAMVFLYKQMTKLMDGYELRLTYNTVDGLYAGTEMNDYILKDGTMYATLVGSPNITVNGFVKVACTAFTNSTYCNTLYTDLGISDIYITKYNTTDIKAQAPTEATFTDDLKLFIRNMAVVTTAPSTDYRIIIGFANGTFTTMKLNAGEDTIAPTIAGDAVLYVLSGESYKVTDGLIATDNLYGDISSTIYCTGSGPYSCVATDSSGNTSSTFTRTVTTVNKVTTFSGTDAEQTFTANIGGYYKVELWGAEGGTRGSYGYGGKGAYATATLYLAAGTVVYVEVGGNGDYTDNANTFNDGGAGGGDGSSQGASGGGATDIRINENDLEDRVLIAAGGGGACGRNGSGYVCNGGYGGSTLGGDGSYSVGTYSGYGASQTAGGAGGTTTTAGDAGTLGEGGDGGVYSTTTYGAGGGGSGLYGGGGGAQRYGAGGGGSSYAASTLFSISLVAGNVTNGMPTWDGTGTMTGNGSGTTTELDGYAKFTFIAK